MAKNTRVTNIGNRPAAPSNMQSSSSVYSTRPTGQVHLRDPYGSSGQSAGAGGNRPNRPQQMQQVPEMARKTRYFYDYSLLFAIIFTFAMGLLIIYSSSQYTAVHLEKSSDNYYFKRQLIIGSIGLVGAICMSVLDYRWLANKLGGLLIYAAYWGSNILLVMTLAMGLASHGKTRWISIAGVSFQPAEVAKIGIILYLAFMVSVHGPAMKRRKHIITAIGASALPTLLILKQNISSAAIVALIAAVMIFVAIENIKEFVGLGALGVAGLLAAKPVTRFILYHMENVTRPEKYYMRRIVGWAAPEMFPDDAYQTLQSLYAIGSGGMTGHGLGESIQKFGKIPEVQNDMIFAIVCEEFGFIGAATLIIMFIYILYRIYKIAINADDLFGSMICTGVLAHIGIQVVLNIAVVTGVIPNTGVTLPFISYGGSAVAFTMAEIGLVLSVAHKIKYGER